MATKSVKEKEEMAEGQMAFAAFDMAQKLLVAACGPVPTIVISSAKGKLQIGAALNGSEAAILMQGTITGLDGFIEIPADQFLSALKGRKSGALSFKDNVLRIKSGNYSAEVNTTESKGLEAIDIPEGEDVQEFTITPALHQLLSTKLPLIRIERIHSALPDVMLNVRISPKTAYMASYDAQQLCFVNVKLGKDEVIEEKLNLCLPYTRFTSFIKDLPVADCRVYVNGATLTAVSKQFKVKIALPHIEPDSFHDPEVVFEKAKGIKELTGKVFTIPLEQLQGFLDNSRTLVSVGTEVSFVPAKGGTMIKIESQHGSTKLTVKGEVVEKAFSLDHRFVQTLLSKQERGTKKVAQDEEETVKEVSFELIDDAFALCRANATYLALLNASAEPD